MSDDDWVKAAMFADAMVADALLSLKRTDRQLPPPPPPPPLKQSSPAPPLDWSVRQRRSRHPARHHDVEMKKIRKTDGEPARASPTTPLSWSCAASVSGGSEESSKPPKPTGGSRSKVSVRSEATTSKRPRKKKTLAELREEETLLLKERKRLRIEIAAMRHNMEKQRVTNESLNRMKLDLKSQQKTKTVTASALSGRAITDQPKQVDSVCEPQSIMLTDVHCNGLDALERSCASNESRKLKELEDRETAFSLPDLNLPAEGDLGSEVLCGMS